MSCLQVNCNQFIWIVTSRVCGWGNVFVMSMCVCLLVYLSVCLSVWAITFKAVDIEPSVFCMVVHLDHTNFEHQGHWIKVKVIHLKMLIWLPDNQFNLVWFVWGQYHKWGQGHTKVRVIPRPNCKFDFQSASGRWAFDWKAFLLLKQFSWWGCKLVFFNLNSESDEVDITATDKLMFNYYFTCPHRFYSKCGNFY